MQSILLIDDSKAVTYIVKKFLEHEGYQVKTALNAYRGLDLLRQESYDLIISDIMMPGMDGFEFADVLKKDDALKDVPLIFFTAKGDISDEFHGYMSGAEYYITKPVKKLDMLEKIELALGIKSKEDDLEMPALRGKNPSKKKEAGSAEDVEEWESSLEEGIAAGALPDTPLDVKKLKEIINIYGSMIEVMWAFSFDKLLSFENLNIIEMAIDRTCLDFPFIGSLAFSEEGIELKCFKEKVQALPLTDVNHGLTSLIGNFFDIIIKQAEGQSCAEHTICLVGDDVSLLSDLENALTIDGYTVNVAEGGDELVGNIVKTSPEVVVLALQVMDEDSQELCRGVRDALSSGISVVAVSNSDDKKVRKLGFEAGADEVMSTPWSKLTLLRMINKLVKK